MATRGRPKGSKNQSTNTIVVDNSDYSSLQQLNILLTNSNDKLLETLFNKSKTIEELESEIGKLEDELDHLKEIIKSLAEVL